MERPSSGALQRYPEGGLTHSVLLCGNSLLLSFILLRCLYEALKIVVYSSHLHP
jgi:hypothetical protein